MSSATPTTEPWTTRRLLAWMTEAFTKKDLDAPRLSTEILLGHVLRTERLKLYMDPDRQTSPAELDTLRALVARALKHEPVQYLTGEAWFFGLPFTVDRRVLIPRPCTELIVERVLEEASEKSALRADSATINGDAPVLVGDEIRAKNKTAAASSGAGLRIADICTGSGCIAVAIAKRLPGAQLIATDISPDALQVAQANAQRHGVIDRIEFLQGDLLPALAGGVGVGVGVGVGAGSGAGVPPAALDAIVSNPPYIPDHEWDNGQVDANVKLHEPALALRAGPDGLQFVRPLIEQAHKYLKPGGLLLIEIAAATAAAVQDLAANAGQYRDIAMLKDLEGQPRVLSARRL